MFNFFNLKSLLNWRLVGPHLCTLAVAVSLNNTWRAPREAFRYGGLTSALLNTVAFVGIALPVVLLQLAVGQLSQQDAVGIWKAVPFFQGIGYLRLLISCISAVYSMVYVAMSLTYVLYTLSNTLPLWECYEISELPDDRKDISYHTLSCLNDSFLAPINEQPEYYVALAFIIIVLWILFPFILYNPVKLMKRILYAFTPLVLLLGVTIVSSIGDKRDVITFHKSNNWKNFVTPNIWHGAIAQALLSSQTAGGYLISSGDSIYANTNVQWTSILIVGGNLIGSWLGILFWFAISGDGDKASSNIAVLVQIYKKFIDNNLRTVWPLLTFLLLVMSGAITMLTFLYPLYDRFHRVGGYKWRHVSMGSSIIGAVGTLSILFVGHPALTLLEDTVVPFLLSVATAMEVSVFIFIYGQKTLVADIDFLIESKLAKYWILGWYANPGIMIPFTVWWSISFFLEDPSWTEAPWSSSGIIASASTTLVIIVIFAALSVAKQVQYDFLGKLKSSFKPSRHWGPRDPITHHYWLARREEADRNTISSRYRIPNDRYRRRQLGQFSGNSSFADVPRVVKVDVSPDIKRRSNSDDWLVISRKQHIAQLTRDTYESRKRSRSLNWNPIKTIQLRSSKDFQHASGTNKDVHDSSTHSNKPTNNNIISNINNDLV